MGQSKNSFARIRSDHRSEVADDYVEAIAEFQESQGQCRGVDLVNFFSVSHATVTQTLSRLKEAGLVESEPYGPIHLTRKGRRLATQSKQRHEIVLAFLLALGVSEATAEMDAEGMEHHVSDETLQRFQAYLDRK